MRNSLGMFNAAKGVMVVLIILTHSMSDFLAGKPPYAFLSGDIRGLVLLQCYLSSYAPMPLFFAFCGYGFRHRRQDLLIRNSLVSVLKAYGIVSLSVIGIRTLTEVLSGGNAVQTLFTECVSYLFALQPETTFRGIFFDSNGPLWFLWTFFWAVILFNQILTLNKPRCQTSACVLLALAGLFLSRYSLPFCLQKILICPSFLYIGWLMSREKLLEKRFPWHLAAVTVLYTLALVFKSGYPLFFSADVYPNGLPDLIAVWLNVFVLMYPAAHLGTCSGPLADFLCWTGKNAFLFCCFHTVELKALPFRNFIRLTVKSRYLTYMVLFLVSSVWAYGLTYAFERCIKSGRREIRSQKDTGNGSLR